MCSGSAPVSAGMVHGAGGGGVGSYSSRGVHASSIASVGRQLCHSVCRGSTTALRSCAAATHQRCNCRSSAAILRLSCRSVVAAAQLLCSSSTTAPPQPCSCFTAALPHLCSSCLHLIYRRLQQVCSSGVAALPHHCSCISYVIPCCLNLSRRLRSWSWTPADFFKFQQCNPTAPRSPTPSIQQQLTAVSWERSLFADMVYG